MKVNYQYHPDYGFKDCFIAGGAILSDITKAPVNDIDIYPKNWAGFEDAISLLIDEGGYIVTASPWAVTIKMPDTDPITGHRKVYQIVNVEGKFTPKAKDIFKNFDFSVCMVAYDCDTKKMKYHPDFWKDVALKNIRVNPKMNYPFKTLLRINKYKERGYSISVTEYAKASMVMAEKGFPKDWESLQKQLGGHYGKKVFLKCNDLEYNFENVIKVLENCDLEDSYVPINESELPWHNADYLLYLAIHNPNAKFKFIGKKFTVQTVPGEGETDEFSLLDIPVDFREEFIRKNFKSGFLDYSKDVLYGYKWLKKKEEPYPEAFEIGYHSILAPPGKSKRYKHGDINTNKNGMYICTTYEGAADKLLGNYKESGDWVLTRVWYSPQDIVKHHSSAYQGASDLNVSKLYFSKVLLNNADTEAVYRSWGQNPSKGYQIETLHSMIGDLTKPDKKEKSLARQLLGYEKPKKLSLDEYLENLRSQGVLSDNPNPGYENVKDLF